MGVRRRYWKVSIWVLSLHHTRGCDGISIHGTFTIRLYGCHIYIYIYIYIHTLPPASELPASIYIYSILPISISSQLPSGFDILFVLSVCLISFPSFPFLSIQAHLLPNETRLDVREGAEPKCEAKEKKKRKKKKEKEKRIWYKKPKYCCCKVLSIHSFNSFLTRLR